jgi:hypothetical protein
MFHQKEERNLEKHVFSVECVILDKNMPLLQNQTIEKSNHWG